MFTAGDTIALRDRPEELQSDVEDCYRYDTFSWSCDFVILFNFVLESEVG